MMTLDDITSRDWSMRLDAGIDGAGLGDVVQSYDDVSQCLGIILTTPKGTDPLRPDFACDVHEYLDRPVDVMLPHLVRAVTAAIERYEPRVVLLGVTATPTGEQGGGHVEVTLTWRLNVQSPAATRRTNVLLGGAGT